MFSNKLFILATLLLPVLSAPSSLLTISKVANPVPDGYIVTLKKGVSRATHVSSIQRRIASSPSNITHEFDIINGYAAHLSPDDLEELRANPDVVSIEQDVIVRISETVTQNDAPWGLARISSREMLSGSSDTALDFKYKYDSTGGSGVSVYVIDTGIFIDHPAFSGRAIWGKTFGGYPDLDENGHGTLCAGIAISGPFGVAKSANAIAVKVLGKDGTGRGSDIVQGIQWVAEAAKQSNKPAVASMSFVTPAADAIDSAVKALQAAGVTVVVGAGNNGNDAGNVSPARVKEVITVGASDFSDNMASFSNFGPSVDIFAPGVDITSTSTDGQSKVSSGTSMATPHVSGQTAYLLSIDSSLTPTNVAFALFRSALSGVLKNIPPGTVNMLLNNGL